MSIMHVLSPDIGEAQGRTQGGGWKARPGAGRGAHSSLAISLSGRRGGSSISTSLAVTRSASSGAGTSAAGLSVMETFRDSVRESCRDSVRVSSRLVAGASAGTSTVGAGPPTILVYALQRPHTVSGEGGQPVASKSPSSHG